MIPRDEAAVCRECPIPHIINCPECYGFGMVKAEGIKHPVPLSAGTALDTNRIHGPGHGTGLHHLTIAAYLPCEMCGSTKYGVMA